MLNIDTLDTMIAVVVVILLLSLIVQAIQGLIKKLLKIKSKQIEASLLDLFNAVMRDRAAEPNDEAKRPKTRIPGIFAPSPEPVVSEGARKLLTAVKKEMQELGRVCARGNFAVDSLSKRDLLNVIARVAPGEFGANLESALAALKKLQTTVEAVNAEALPADVGVLWAKFRGALAPLKQHYNALTAGTAAVAPGVIVADVLALRGVVFDDSLDLLAKVQQAAGAQTEMGKSVAAISKDIIAAREALDESFGAFQTKLVETEQWFDTTMQSFEERYHRGMRTWSIIIAAVVVIFLDANLFSIYKRITTSESLRANLVNSAPRITQLQERIAKAEAGRDPNEKEPQTPPAADAGTTTEPSATETTGTTTGVTTTGLETTTTVAVPTTDQPTTPSGTPAPPDPATLERELEKDRQELNKLVGEYTAFGFEPMTWARLRGFGRDFLNVGTKHPVNGNWLERRVRNVRTLFGWLIMTLLLSLGAPFWHDALESLFGVKNLLRRKNEQQNVEQAKGAGNPKV